MKHDQHQLDEDTTCPGLPADVPPGKVEAALQLDIDALRTAGQLQPNTTSVQEGARALARVIDSGVATPSERAAALREMRAALDSVRMVGPGAAAAGFRDKVKRAGARAAKA